MNNLISENVKYKLLEYVNPFLEKLKQRKENLGIILLGGLGKRDFLDRFSDVDISVITLKKDRRSFPIPFEFHYFYDDVNCIEFNIHQLILEDELNVENIWDEGKIEAYSNAIIYDDPFGYAKRIIDLKVVFNEKKAFDRLVWIMQQYRWRGQIHSLRCYERGCPESGQGLINHCVDLLLEAVFLLNKVYLPHKKWVFTFLENLKKGSNLKELFSRAMIITDLSLECAKQRIAILDQIYTKIWEIIDEVYPSFPKEPYEYYYRHYVQVNEYTPADKIFYERTGKMRIENDCDRKLFGEICYNVDKI